MRSGDATVLDVIVEASLVRGWLTVAVAVDVVSVPSSGWGV